MRTYDDIFKGENPKEFLMKCHPINGVSGFKLFFEQVLGYQFKEFHSTWISPLINGKFYRIGISAPTGFGKSQLFGIGFPLWNMWFNTKNWNWSGLIVSTSMPQSNKILERVKDEIINNELLSELRSTNPTFAWSTTDIKLKNGTTLGCRPLNDNVKSYHVDYVFSDEVASYNKIPGGVNCFYKYVSTRMAAKKGQLAAVSTPESEEDLLAELQSKDVYFSIVTSALINPETKEPDINGVSIWPERFPRDYLMERREELGPHAFSLQYMCDTSMPIDDKDFPFPLSLLARNSDKAIAFEYKPDPEADSYVASYDPAFSSEGDYNAIILAKVKDNKIYISQMQRYKGDPDDAIAILCGWNELFKLEKVVVDTNAGGWKVFRDMTKFNLPVVSFPFDARSRLGAFREAKKHFHSAKVILPMNELDSQTKHMMKIFFNEMTHISVGVTPKTKMPTYISHTKHDDIAMSFIMLINSLAQEGDFGSLIRTGKDSDSTLRQRERGKRTNKRHKNVIHVETT